jgi:predicted nucleotidyltransferase
MPVLVDATHPLWSVVEQLSGSELVKGVALVGSRVGDLAVPDSDYDVFIYTEGDLADLRAEMADELADASSWRSVREHAFADEDAWRLGADGPWLDLMYWSTVWAEEQLDEVLVQHRARIGYSTAFWRSIRMAQPLSERDTWHAALQRRAQHPYPDPLRRNIVDVNYPYLRDHPYSFRHQLTQAIARHDAISVNHRLAAWLASYVDIVFAVNRVLHPGEKRILEFLARECTILPAGALVMLERLASVACGVGSDVLESIDPMLAPLDDLLQAEGLLPSGHTSAERG